MQTESYRMQAVQSPIIPVVAELIRQCPGTISLGQGVVYYGPPQEAIAQLPKFLSDCENHKYKPVLGIAPLVDAIAAKLKAENSIDINTKNCIVVTAGSNMAFMNAVLAITNPGDEIILQTPYYFNHEMAIAMASCRPVIVATDENYQLRPDAIREAITDKTRAVVTISPNNPSGVVYPEEALREVNEICRSKGIYHINDEAYEYFTYNNVKHFSPGAIASSSGHTISLYTLSKAYGFASWRIGYMVIPEHLRVSVNKIQDTILICPPVISQYAALGALQAGVGYCREKMSAIASVRETVLNELNRIPDLCTIPPADGAFYFLLKINSKLDAMELVERLIREHGVAVIPGTTFGMEDGCYLRVAYGALEKDTAAEGIGRLVRGLQTILKS
ncbi:pyridoxal phosphate-dependent aminotransferase [Microcoleus sp. FACHB-831]|uniref:pyridoxal phosphate-dependent aminotransferase n=1 Tax=Microcoleus sp. FACHB-831 TaxID=2692827 RepID=UPI00168A37A7|nr:pyridoxal phosphate-dependent aminotransferase [Microcoleus sp. FACHB-831]MBD1923518.1 pyridoxal phosphate-dependent aminotransferase [Microcoleus sp. FACHB-831]